MIKLALKSQVIKTTANIDLYRVFCCRKFVCHCVQCSGTRRPEPSGQARSYSSDARCRLWTRWVSFQPWIRSGCQIFHSAQKAWFGLKHKLSFPRKSRHKLVASPVVIIFEIEHRLSVLWRSKESTERIFHRQKFKSLIEKSWCSIVISVSRSCL